MNSIEDTAGRTAQIGVDEWALHSGERIDKRSGLGRVVSPLAERVPWHVRLLVAFIIASALPVATSSGYIVTVGVNTLLLILLCLGLNVAVGWAGMLDLGYMAFYGLGAYVYSIVSSDQLNGPTGIHLPTFASVPFAVIATGLVALVVGLTSSRVAEVYLALVTLFFAQIFLQTVSIVALPISGGPYGITNVDPFAVFGHALTSAEQYYFFTLIAVAVLIVILRSLERSRIGRAWRAVREDEFVAAFATIPTKRVKIYAFVFGAMVAGFAGCVFAAFEAGTYPTDFGLSELFLIYAALILGGIGSIGGAAVGAIIVSVGIQLLQSTTEATSLFFAVIVLALVARVRPWKRLGVVVASEIAFGLIVHSVVGALTSTGSAFSGRSVIARGLNLWLVNPRLTQAAVDWLYIGLLAMIVGAVVYPQLRRWAVLVPGIYFASIVWVSVLVPNSTTTSELLLGAMLIVGMIVRPRGLLGTMPKEMPR